MENKELLEKCMIENIHLHENLMEQEFALQKKTILLKKMAGKIKNQQNIINQKNRELKICKTSFRYRVGTCIYDATSSLKGFVFLPIRLVKLFIEYKNSK